MIAKVKQNKLVERKKRGEFAVEFANFKN